MEQQSVRGDSGRQKPGPDPGSGGAAISLDWPGPPINHFMAVIKEYRGTPDLPGVAGSLAQVCEDKC